MTDILITGQTVDRSDEILTPQAMSLIARLDAQFHDRRDALLGEDHPLLGEGDALLGDNRALLGDRDVVLGDQKIAEGDKVVFWHISANRDETVFTDPDTVRELIHNFNRDGFEALYPRYRGGRPPTFTLPQRRQIKQIALSDPLALDLPFATWSLAKLADYLVAEGVVTDISHEGLRQLLTAEGVRFQAVRTWKRSNDPDFAAIAQLSPLFELLYPERAASDPHHF